MFLNLYTVIFGGRKRRIYEVYLSFSLQPLLLTVRIGPAHALPLSLSLSAFAFSRLLHYMSAFRCRCSILLRSKLMIQIENESTVRIYAIND